MMIDNVHPSILLVEYHCLKCKATTNSCFHYNHNRTRDEEEEEAKIQTTVTDKFYRSYLVLVA